MYASIPERYHEEQVFIREIWFAPDEPSARLVYADWLEEHADVRAEILRNDVQFWELGERNDEPANELREQLTRKRQRIVRPLHWQWIALIGTSPIDICIEQTQLHMRPLGFEVRCPLRWENLHLIGEDASVRFCSECQRAVHYCWDTHTARQHARSGNCVALDPSVARAVRDQFRGEAMLGMLEE